MLSVRNFVIRISFAGIGPLLGYITDHINLTSAFVLAGAIYLVVALIIVWPWLKLNKS